MMRKLGGLLLCAMAVCGPAWAADGIVDARAAIARYAQRFDNAYMAAARAHPVPIGVPYDSSAATDAQQAHDQAMDKCFDRQTEFATRRAWMECFLSADAAYAAAVHLSDTQLLASFLEAVRSAGDDADAGRLPPEQLASVYFALAEAYAGIIHDQDANWRKTHMPR